MESSSNLTKDQNSRMAGRILQESLRSNLERTKLREIARILREVKNKGTLADVGCFDGSLSAAYFRCGFGRVDGFDISLAALERAEKVGVNTSIWNFETETSPAPDDTYDALVCSDVIEHVYNTQNLVNECRRILKPGGTAVILVPNLASLHNRFLVSLGKMPYGSPGVSVSHKTEPQVNLGHARLGTSREWHGLLTSGGFLVVEVRGLWSSSLARAAAFSRATLAHSIIYKCLKK